ncbi:MAG: CHAP domain-containing protein [Rhodospirillales bacterium]|nr:CHAP domain-containing protein [Rhodospirillales bacterium]
MTGRKTAYMLLAALGFALLAEPVLAQQCVPFARQNSQIFLRGDAWMWWKAAEGRYARGHRPEVGSILVFQKSGKMRRGHVAVVTQVIDERKILIEHSNWQPSGRGKGQVATSVAVIDLSPRNDWTQVRVWYGPVKDFGSKTYPTYGFIYPKSEADRVPEIIEANYVEPLTLMSELAEQDHQP